MTIGIGMLLSAAGAQAATTVAPGSNLTTVLGGATTGDHDFLLEGNVYMSGAFSMNATSLKEIFINGWFSGGQRAVITRNAAADLFNVNSVGNALTIQNAIITTTATSGGYGAVYVTSGSSVLDFDNTLFSKNTAGDVLGFGGAISLMNGTNTTINGDVSFSGNKAIGQGAGAVGIYGGSAAARSTVTFTGETYFEGNFTGYYGGAVTVNYYATAIFKEDAVFRGNYTTLYYGGAMDLYGGDSKAIFEKNAEFTGNYVRNTAAQAYGVRGGAVNVGFITGTSTPQLEFKGTATFKDNYVWGLNTTKSYGGALSIISGEANPDITIPPVGREYQVIIHEGVFSNNIAHSDSGNAYGGAIFAKTVNNVLTIGDAGTTSSFTNNYAKTLGGAIYFDQGTLNLTGNVAFSGNRQGAEFDTSSGRPVYVDGTGSANAIYFAVSSNTATLNLANQSGEVISFADPIQSAAGKTVTVNKTGAGKVVFTGHDSDILAQTTVSGGIFELGTGVAYGRLGTNATSNFNLANGATLVGNAGATLTASKMDFAGRVEVTGGRFSLQSSNAAGVTLASSAVLALVITDKDNYASLDLGGQKLALGGSTLEIIADDYVPSTDNSDFFTIITSVAGLPDGQFAQGDSIFINGAEFEILYGANSVVLQQISSIPEPSTYALVGGAGLLGLMLLRRRRAAGKENG